MFPYIERCGKKFLKGTYGFTLTHHKFDFILILEFSSNLVFSEIISRFDC